MPWVPETPAVRIPTRSSEEAVVDRGDQLVQLDPYVAQQLADHREFARMICP